MVTPVTTMREFAPNALCFDVAAWRRSDAGTTTPRTERLDTVNDASVNLNQRGDLPAAFVVLAFVAIVVAAKACTLQLRRCRQVRGRLKPMDCGRPPQRRRSRRRWPPALRAVSMRARQRCRGDAIRQKRGRKSGE
jgi:hypothetical protein